MQRNKKRIGIALFLLFGVLGIFGLILLYQSLTKTPPPLTNEGSVDTIPPAAITDLAASNITNSSVTLTWTAPGDDGNTGTARFYNIRYSTTPYTKDIRWLNLAIALELEDSFSPGPAGTAELISTSRLSAGTTYYFGIKTRDELNRSSLSNIISVTTLSASDTISPSVITDLAASNITNSSVTLTWTAPGDDGNTGTATSYDVIYSELHLGSEKVILPTEMKFWRRATQVIGEPTPQVSGTSQSMTVSGLYGDLYNFAIRTSDEAPNWSGFSNVVGLTTAALTPVDDTAP